MHACLVDQLYSTLCDPMDCGPPGSFVCGIFQARILEWVLPNTEIELILLHWQADSLTLSHKGNPNFSIWNLYFSSHCNIIVMGITEFYNLHLLVILQFSQFSHSIVYDSLRPHGPQHARSPCPTPTPDVYSNSCPLSQWCHPTISSSVIPFSSHLQSFPASGPFQTSQFFTSGGQNIGISASASVLPMDIQDLFPLGWTGWISLQSKGLSRVFSSTTVLKRDFFSTQLSL